MDNSLNDFLNVFGAVLVDWVILNDCDATTLLYDSCFASFMVDF